MGVVVKGFDKALPYHVAKQESDGSYIILTSFSSSADAERHHEGDYVIQTLDPPGQKSKPIARMEGCGSSFCFSSVVFHYK